MNKLDLLRRPKEEMLAMPRPACRLLIALSLGLLAVLPARAEPGAALDNMLEGGAFEAVLLRALAGIDLDTLIIGFEQQAQAAAEGRAPDPEQLAHAQARIEQQMAQTAPLLMQDTARLLAPVLRELRQELGRELAGLERD